MTINNLFKFFYLFLFTCTSFFTSLSTTYSNEQIIRIASFNCSLNRNATNQLQSDLKEGTDKQIQKVAQIIQLVKPDIILLNEFDFDPTEKSVALFQKNFLNRSSVHSDPIYYPYFFAKESNTGLKSDYDLNNDGKYGTAADALGYGKFPGQYGMLILSKFEIDHKNVRTFQKFLWKDMPQALLPKDPKTENKQSWYSDQELDIFRLSSKSHWDIPIKINDKLLHILASHPTPPVFDGKEDANGKRNHDEIRLWIDYISGQNGHYIYDDNGKKSLLPQNSYFAILGDLNADPFDGDQAHNAIKKLLNHSNINTDFTPESRGAVEASFRQANQNNVHQGKADYDTADFGEPPGNLRVDYVLPSKNLSITGGGVFWPPKQHPLSSLVSASDHRLVWVDIKIN